MKGQISVEFLAAGLIFLMGVVFVVNILTGSLPEYLDQKEEESINVEMKRISDHLVKKKGEPGWTSNPNSADNIGLASEYMVLSESKVQSLEDLDYLHFTEAMDLDHTYNFNFTEYPVIDTSKYFYKNSTGEMRDIDIVEPDNPYYKGAGRIVRYGSRNFTSTDRSKFLVTSHDAEYDTFYISEDWNFSNSNTDRRSVGDILNLGGKEYTIENLQNEGEYQGSSIVLKRPVAEFGAPLTTGSREVINRYVSYDAGENLDLMKVRVTGW